MRSSHLTLITGILWLTLPLTLGDLLADAVADQTSAVRGTVAVLAWTGWSVVLLAALIPLPVTLTLTRVLVPIPAVAGVVAAIGTTPDLLGWIGLAAAAGAGAMAMSAEVGDRFVNGSSYGDERRMALRPPAAVLLGPVELLWIVTACPAPIGMILVADGAWAIGTVLLIGGIGTAVIGFRTLDRLARRWVVFVPAGITVVDDLALAEPILFPRTHVVRLGPAPVDTGALDLSVGASGLILQIDLDAHVELVPAVRRGRTTEAVAVASVLIAPGRPGALLAHAEGRRIAVSRA